MNADRFETLLAEFLDGRLSPGQHQELLDAAAQNPQWGHRLIEILRFEPLIADFMRGDAEGEGFLRRVQQRLEKAGDSARFAKAVVDQLRQRHARHAGKSSGRMAAVPSGKSSARMPAAPSGKSSARMAAIRKPGSSAHMHAVSRSSIRIRTLRAKRSYGYGLTLSAAAAVLLLAIGMLLRAFLAPETQKFSVANLSGIKGSVYLLHGASRQVVVSDTPVAPGQGVETGGASSRVVISYPDGTSLELQPQSVISELADGTASSSTLGKTIHLVRGSLNADVARQPVGRPMLITTATARVRVIGTRFTLEGMTGSTRLSVSEGLVELTRKSDEKSVQVAGGQFVVAPDKGELLVQAASPVLPPSAQAASAEDDKLAFTAASFFGGSGVDAITAAEIQSDGTVVFGANMDELEAHGRPILLNGSSESSRGVLIRLAASGRTVLSIIRIAEGVNDLSIDAADNIYAATTNCGVMKINSQASEVLWKSDDGECQRVDAAADGTAVALFKANVVRVFSAEGRSASEFASTDVLADVAIESVSKRVFTVGHRPGNAARGEIGGVAILMAQRLDGTPLWTGYGYAPSTLTPDSVHTQGCRMSMGRDGRLYASFLALGANNIFRFGPQGLSTPARLIEHDDKSRLQQTGNSPITFFGCYEPENGALLYGQFLLGGEISTKDGDIKADESGRVYLAGLASDGGPYTSGAVGIREFTGRDGFLFIDYPARRERELFTTFTTGASGVTAMYAVAARVLPGRTKASVAVGGIVSGQSPAVWTRDAIQPAAGDGVDGFFAVVGAQNSPRR